jgi:hypothetical protein
MKADLGVVPGYEVAARIIGLVMPGLAMKSIGKIIGTFSLKIINTGI